MATRIILILAIGSLVLGALATAAPPAVLDLDCPVPVHVPGLGSACAVPGGYEVSLPDGRTLFTHGPDPIPTVPLLAPAVPAPVACVDESGPHMRVVLAFPSDYPSPQTSNHAKAVVAGVLDANAVVAAAGAKFGVPMALKVLCDEDGLPKVFPLYLSTTAAQTDFGSLWAESSAAGFGQGLEKVWAFTTIDGSSCDCGGISSVNFDTSPGPENRNNGGGTFSVSYMGEFGTPWIVQVIALHELSHAMGAVQPGAPDSSGEIVCQQDWWTGQWTCYGTGFHCNDGIDVMCYADGASRSEYRTTDCPAGTLTVALTAAYDCGNDSYFHPAPPEGSYLSGSWNVGGVNNQYVQRG